MKNTRHTPGAIGLVLLVACVLALGGAATGNAEPVLLGSPDTYVAEWDSVGVQAFSASGLGPAEGHVIFAYVAIAVYDAVMSIEGGYEPFAVDVDAPAGASAEAAVVGAASTVLKKYLPGQAAMVDAARTASLLTIPDGPAKMNGLAFGDAVAALVIAQRAGDGFRAPTPPYVAPVPPIPGVWIPTAPTPPECNARAKRSSVGICLKLSPGKHFSNRVRRSLRNCSAACANATLLLMDF